MPDHAGPPQRRERLRARLAAADVDALLVTTQPNVRYLTGFTGSAGRLLITVDGQADRFVTDGRYDDQSAAEVAGLERIITRGDRWIADTLGPRRRLGVESHHLPWDAARALAERLQDAAVVPAAGHVEALRVVKEPGEIEVLRRACAIGDAAFADLLTWLRPGVSEREAAGWLDRAMMEHGAEDRAFPPIVASGDNAARPHHRAGDRRLRPGDLVTIDCGARVDGYHSDMTRLVALGAIDTELARVVSEVRRAQAEGLAQAVDGISCADLDAACRTVLDAAGYGDRFVHGSGHGVGLELHEAPRLGQDAPGTLAAGMTVTVEPGVYLPGLGGARIEDTVVVGPSGQPEGPIVLTRTPKDLVVL